MKRRRRASIASRSAIRSLGRRASWSERQKGLGLLALPQHPAEHSIVCNIGHFDSEIDIASLKDCHWDEIKPQVDHVTFPNGNKIIILAKGRLVNLGCATGHPSYVMSNSFTNQMLAQIDLFTNPTNYATGQLYLLPKHLDEKVARLHLGQIGAELTTLTETQAKYINVAVEGPYKLETYRY